MPKLEVEVAIIGAGTAGLAAYRAARAHTASLALIEGGPYGTTCARVGCMPSKLLIAAAEAAHACDEAPVFGVHPQDVRIDGKAVLERVRALRDRFVGHVVAAIEKFPPEHEVRGQARFRDDHTLQVGEDTEVRAERIVIAAGSRPRVLPLLRDAGELLITSDDIFELPDLPRSVAVFGPGVIGLELAQALHRLGARVRIFGKGGDVARLSDPKVRDYACATFAREFPLDPDAEVRAVRRRGDEVEIAFLEDGAEQVERFERVLAATGRTPNLDLLDLERTGLELDRHGVPLFDPTTCQCGQSHIFIAGDVDNYIPLLHEAADEGAIAGENAARFPDVRAHPRRCPLAVVFCDPQIASVGKTFGQLQAEGAAFAAGEVSFEDQGRSRVTNKNRGLLRVYGERGSGLFLGAEMIGPAAEHIGHLLAWAAQQRLSVPDMLAMPYYHPVVEEGVRTALRALNRALLMGPEPVPRCLDCGPGG